MTRRPGVGFRWVFVALALALLVLAVTTTVTAVTSVTLASPILIIVSGVSVWGARICIGAATSRVVATPDGVTIRNPVGRRQVRWPEVESVEPTHNGLALRLRDGTTVVAWATAKSGLRFLKPRVDHEALSYFRDHLSAS